MNIFANMGKDNFEDMNLTKIRFKLTQHILYGGII